MISLEVRAGASAGRVFHLEGDDARIGHDPSCEVHLQDELVAQFHARVLAASSGLIMEALSPNVSVARLRAGQRALLGEDGVAHLVLSVGDLIELGQGEQATVLAVVSTGEHEPSHAKVVVLRRMEDLAQQRSPAAERLGMLFEEQRRIGVAQGLQDVLTAVADAALYLVSGSTHATVVLRDLSDGGATYVPVLTRVRGSDTRPTSPQGPVPVVRAIVRKVLSERAAVLTADASQGVISSDSLIGASIRSTIGVPLVRGEEILGVLQVDNRQAPAMMTAADVDTLAVLSATASLAINNARLIERLHIAEDRLERENSYLRSKEAERRGNGHNIVGRSAAMNALLSQVGKVADTRVSVLIEGETGTGKELIASALHEGSRRRDKLFVTQNCAAMPESLLESELFGHKRGAFTGATEEKKGLFELAHGGTLFLDEIGELALPLQAKLLRVLQEGEIRPVGATQVRRVDVRIVAATNRSLEDEVKAGRFREDLYYRLKVFPLRTPPLRERREDIPLLAGHFLSHYARELGKITGGFAQHTMELLVSYDWPGNVRELQNEVQRLVIQVDLDGIITPDFLSPHLRKVEGVVARAGVPKGTLKEMVESFERYILREALRDHNNNKTNAARTLGITREGLHKKLRQLGVD